MVVIRRKVWSSRNEFISVYESLFGDDSSTELGLGQIQVWVSRGNCPQLAEVSGQLIRLEHLDKDNIIDSSSLNLAYAMALIRFVNSVVDPMQTGQYAQSISQLAKSVGLPASFVELRHAATHEDLPSLVLLRQATSRAIEWLKENYWDKVLASFESLSPEDITQIYMDTRDIHVAQLRGGLNILKQAQKQLDKDITFNIVHERTVGLQRLDNTLSAIYDTALNMSNGDDAVARNITLGILVDVLVEPGCLVPHSIKKRANSGKSLPKSLKNTYLPFLKHHAEADLQFAPTLVTQLLQTIQSYDEQHKETSDQFVTTLKAWLIYLCTHDFHQYLTNTLKLCLLNLTPSSYEIASLLYDGMCQLESYAELAQLLKPVVELMRIQCEFMTLPTLPLTDSEIQKAIATLEERSSQIETRTRNAKLQWQRQKECNDSSQEHKPKKAKQTLLSQVSHWIPAPIGYIPKGFTSLLLAE